MIAAIIIGIIILLGFVYLIWEIRNTIRFNKALKDYRKELPEMIKEGLVDPDKIINAKFPEF